jgi:hypothetical protein
MVNVNREESEKMYYGLHFKLWHNIKLNGDIGTSYFIKLGGGGRLDYGYYELQRYFTS